MMRITWGNPNNVPYWLGSTFKRSHVNEDGTRDDMLVVWLMQERGAFGFRVARG